MLLLLPLLPALLACQEPFGTDRHVLEGFRIVGLSAPGGAAGEATVPAPALVVDGRLWSDEPVDLRWYWLDDPHDLDDPDALDPVATGPAPTLTLPEAPVLGLVATAPDGTERAAFLELGADPEPLPPPAVELEVLPLTVGDVEADDLDVEARAELVGEPSAYVPVGGFARLRADGGALIRWTATAGTWFELEPRIADWGAGVVRLDDEEVVERQPLEAGLVSAVLVALDDGRTAWTVTDIAVGEPGEGARVGGRWFPSDGPVPSGPVRATLVADDASPTGLRLVDPEPFDPAEGWGTESLPCEVPVSGPLDPRWLVDGRCTRAALDGARVGLEAE